MAGPAAARTVDAMATSTKIQPRALVRASGGPRYAVALAVDALGTGLLRPFLLLYGVTVLRLSAPATGIAMTVGVVVALVCMPAVGRWLDRGARSTVVAASMLVRVVGVALLLAAPAGHVWLFATAALFLGIGNQAWPAAHAALVATVAHGRERDAALAAGRALRNAGLGAGALLATACLAGGTTALQALAAVTGLAYLAAAALAWSVHLHAHPAATSAKDRADGPAPRMRALLAANVVYVFCLNVPEIALPLVLVTQLHASPVWPAAIFVANTVLVVTLQVPVTVLMSRFSRRTVLALAGVVLAASYLGFLAATSLGHGWGAPAVADGVRGLHHRRDHLCRQRHRARHRPRPGPCPGTRPRPLPALHGLRPRRLPGGHHRSRLPRRGRALGQPRRCDAPLRHRRCHREGPRCSSSRARACPYIAAVQRLSACRWRSGGRGR